jgi:septal ring factor EnvC (AmiA/AmiB activator)
MRITRALGGYVVSARFNAAKQGTSALVFKIPIDRVQQAIAKFSSLGTIAAQNIRITDLQAQFNQLVKRIGALRVAIAKVDDQLASTSLSNEDRVKLEQRRARLAVRLEALRTSEARTAHTASLATVSLGLTTKEAAAVVKPEHRGPLGRALHDAGHILAKEVAWALYALIVLAPIALIALAAFLVLRGARRLSDRRLLESS